MADTDTNIPDEATATEGTTDKLHLNLHSIIDSSQKQHGILQNNYTNYRQALTRRLKRLTHNVEYKALVSKAAKEKALLAAAEDDKEDEEGDGVSEDLDVVHHVNALLIWLVQAERAWSHSMELKTEYDGRFLEKGSHSTQRTSVIGELKKNSSAGKVRNHFLKKLRKAVKHAEHLEKLCSIKADDVSIAEAVAYASWMRANLDFEMKNWKVNT